MIVNSLTKETRQESYFKTETAERCRMILSTLDKPMTARQIAYKLGFSELNTVRPRLTEMARKGTVEVVGKAYDKATERNVAVYRRVENGN
jgi:predicted ArsR family transcriptional regulator